MSHTKYEFISELYKNILESKYCLELTDPNKNKVYKENFQDAIYRVAHEVNKYDKNKFAEMKQKTIQFISNKDFSPAGGIWRAAGNPSSKVSFVNCTTQPPVKDSIENIFGESLMNWSRIASYGQGNGIDISGLRPRGAKTNNCAKYSTGAVSFLINYDASMQVIGAENRRGATKPDIWIYHPDSEEFISCKSDITKLTSQNISVKIDSHFMQCVEKNKNIELKWKRVNNEVFIGEKLFDNDSPGPNLEITKQINAKNLFQKIAYQAWKTGEPGIEFWDFSEYWSNSNYHPNKKFHIVSTNGCSEQKLDPFNTCVLASINFYNMPLYYENWKDWLVERVSFGIRFLDNVMLAEYEEKRSPHPIQRQKLKEMTRIGLGFTGLYDWFIKNEIIYSSEKSIELTKKIMSVFAESAYRTSIELGKERGSFTEFQKEWFTQSPFIKRLCELTNLKLNDFEFMRHVCCLSVAPTGTLSMVVGTGGNGCEPSFSPYYERKERAVTGEYRTHIIYDNCVLNELKRKKLKVTKKNIDEMIQSEEWVFAAWNKSPKKNINPINKIKLMSELYKYIDSGISVTYNLPESATVKDILEIYFKSWEYELKSVTVYRDKSREGILNHVSDNNNKNKLSKLVSFKRPQEVICDIHQTNVSGQKWIVLIGLIDNSPYEVFCGLLHKNFNPSIYTKGKIFKNEKGNYFLVLKNKDKEIKLDIKKSFKNDGSESAMTRLVSLNLRHHVDIKFIVQQLVKSEGDMTTFAKAISRVLKKYIEDGSKLLCENCPSCQKDTLIHQSNCIVCNECGWSRC